MSIVFGPPYRYVHSKYPYVHQAMTDVELSIYLILVDQILDDSLHVRYIIMYIARSADNLTSWWFYQLHIMKYFRCLFTESFKMHSYASTNRLIQIHESVRNALQWKFLFWFATYTAVYIEAWLSIQRIRERKNTYFVTLWSLISQIWLHFLTHCSSWIY